jgi:hypothetical protein
MGSKVPHKAQNNKPVIQARSTSEKVMIVLGILISISMVIGLFAGVF